MVFDEDLPDDAEEFGLPPDDEARLTPDSPEGQLAGVAHPGEAGVPPAAAFPPPPQAQPPAFAPSPFHPSAPAFGAPQALATEVTP
jgi:hypothetical protein